MSDTRTEPVCEMCGPDGTWNALEGHAHVYQNGNPTPCVSHGESVFHREVSVRESGRAFCLSCGCAITDGREDRMLRAVAAMLAYENAHAIWEPPLDEAQEAAVKQYAACLLEAGRAALVRRP